MPDAGLDTFCQWLLQMPQLLQLPSSHPLRGFQAEGCGSQAYIIFSRAGVFVRLPGVDVARFQESMTTGGLLGYVDALSGGSISRVGVFSLGEPHSRMHSSSVFGLAALKYREAWQASAQCACMLLLVIFAHQLSWACC